MFQMSEVSIQTKYVNPNSVSARWAYCFGLYILYSALGVYVYLCWHGSHNLWTDTDMNLEFGQ